MMRMPPTMAARGVMAARRGLMGASWGSAVQAMRT